MSDRIIGIATVIAAALLVGGAGAVIRLHYRALRDPGRPPGRRGLLSWHVVAISASYLMFAVLVALGLLQRSIGLDVDTWFPFTYRTVGYFVACCLGIAALIIIGRAQLQVHSTNPSPRRRVITEERDTVVYPGSADDDPTI